MLATPKSAIASPARRENEGVFKEVVRSKVKMTKILLIIAKKATTECKVIIVKMKILSSVKTPKSKRDKQVELTLDLAAICIQKIHIC